MCVGVRFYHVKTTTEPIDLIFYINENPWHFDGLSIRFTINLNMVAIIVTLLQAPIRIEDNSLT